MEPGIIIALLVGILYRLVFGYNNGTRFIGILVGACIVYFLVGCDVPDDPCNTVYATSYEQSAPSGLTLAPANDAYINFDEMTRLYNKVQSCVGAAVPGPSVRYVEFKTIGLGGAYGVYMPAGNAVMVNTGDNVRNCKSDRQALKHEFVHHVLYLSGADWSHASPAFARCGAIGVNTCNGEPC